MKLGSPAAMAIEPRDGDEYARRFAYYHDQENEEPMNTETENPPDEVTCRKCAATYVPSFMRDFYQDDKAGPGTGLCERCMMNEVFNKDPVPIPSEEHAENVCKLGKGAETCIFLCLSGGFLCAKGSGMNNDLIRRAEAGTMSASSWNCSGPDDFKVKDVPVTYPTEEAARQKGAK